MVREVQRDITLLFEEQYPQFQPCAIRQRGRCLCLEVNLFCMPLHMSTILNLLTLEPFILWRNSHDHWLGR